MKRFLQSQTFYIKNDSSMLIIKLILLISSVLLALWSVSGSNYTMKNLAEPIKLIVSMSMFLYFIIPLHTCFYACEGFEFGTIKNVIAAGISRTNYYIGKLITEIKAIFFSLLQFYLVFLIVFYTACFLKKTPIANIGLYNQLIRSLLAVIYNFIYLVAYSSIVLTLVMFIRKTAPVVVATFCLIFGDFLICGYLKDAVSPILQAISNNCLMTQVLKFNGLYVKNSQLILLNNVSDYLKTFAIPIAIIIICLIIGLNSFNKQDI